MTFSPCIFITLSALPNLCVAATPMQLVSLAYKTWLVSMSAKQMSDLRMGIEPQHL